MYSRSYSSCLAVIEYYGKKGFSDTDHVHFDRFVQLFESPSFACVRLRLISQTDRKPMYTCLVALSLLLPQSKALEVLQARINAGTCLFSICADDVTSVVEEDSFTNEFKRLFG
ncbi:hypothetical protein GEMRC1_006677 [Eukaryota sp. GEM-RC1]